jgi:hypothetical protein
MIDGYIWREDNKQRREIAQSWRTAMWSRSRRLPSFQEIMAPQDARPLNAEEKAERQAEFDAMTKAIDPAIFSRSSTP